MPDVERRILVIDDEKRLAESLAGLLRDVGYDVDAATGGREGLARLAECEYRLVITDLRMPEVDGFQVMDHISANCPGTAMIVITGHASTQSAIEAIHKRVADYLTKPFEFDLLVASIEKIFARVEAEELRQDMMRMISHDIKVPLNSIMGYAQFLVDKRTHQASERVADYAQKIILNSQRILTLLENYLTHARAEAGSLEIMPQPMKLEETVEEAARMLASDFERKAIHLEVDVQPIRDYFLGDEALIFRAVSNLLNNAAKYSPDGGSARLVLRREARPEFGDSVVITVTNTGPGIPEKDIQTIFSRFRRSATSKGIEGSGLGLFVVKHVVKAHGGRVTCESDLDGETAFHMIMPMKVPEPRRK